MRATSARGTRILLGAGAAALLALTACSSSANDSAGSARSAGDSAAVADKPAAGTEGAYNGPASAGGARQEAPARKNADAVKQVVPTKLAPSERSIVYKGAITVRVQRVNEAAAKASTIATGAGGVIGGDNRRSGGTDDESAELVLRVPSSAFYATVEKLAALGKPLERGLTTEDVTEAVVDIEARIASQKASVDRTRTLLARAERITDLASIEGELARREADLASLQAQQRSLAGQVQLSTITLHLVGPVEKSTQDEKEATFLTGLKNGWNAFIVVVNALLVAIGALLPFLVLIGGPLALAYWLVRRRRATPTPPTAEPAAAPAE